MNFSPIEFTPQERERLRREIAHWTREEAREEFLPLPGESLQEFFEAREAYLRELESFGPLFQPEPSEAWKMVRGQGRAPPRQRPRQLPLPFEASDFKLQK